MPTIVNAYAAPESISNNLRSIAESMFGNEAKDNLIREEAAKARRENEAANAIPGLFQQGDYRATMGQILRHSPTAGNLGGVGLAGAGLDANGNVNDPRLATAAIGAGHPYEGTVPGTNLLEGGRNSRNAATIAGENERNRFTQGQENERNTARIAGESARSEEATRRAAETQRAIAERDLALRKWQSEHTPTTVYPIGPNGRPMPKIVPQSESFGQPGKPLSMDETKGLIISGALDNQPASFGDRFSATDPLANLTNDQRHMLGLPAFTATENLNAPGQTDIPQLPPKPTGVPQSVIDAGDVGGMKAIFPRVAGGAWSTLTGKEQAPQTNASVNRLGNLINDTRGTAFPGMKDTVQREKWNAQVLPSTSLFQEGGEHARNIAAATITKLREQYAAGVNMASDPRIPPEAKANVIRELNVLRTLIGRWEALPEASAPVAAAPAASAPRRIIYDAQGNRVQ